MKIALLPLICTVSVVALTGCTSLPMKPISTPNTSEQQKIVSKLNHSRGLNVEMLLRNEVEQSIQELSQAEQNIAAVRAGMMDVIPSLERLEDLHKDIANLNNRLRKVMSNITVVPVTKETLSNAKPIPITPTPPQPIDVKPIKTSLDKAKTMTAGKPPIEPTNNKVQQPKPKVSVPTPKNGVASIRIGDHDGKTRIVLDIHGETKPVYDLDNDESLMAIELPKTLWNTTKQNNFPKGKLIHSYNVQADKDGSLIAISLTKDTKLLEHFVLKGSKTKPTRYVFDLQR